MALLHLRLRNAGCVSGESRHARHAQTKKIKGAIDRSFRAFAAQQSKDVEAYLKGSLLRYGMGRPDRRPAPIARIFGLLCVDLQIMSDLSETLGFGRISSRLNEGLVSFPHFSIPLRNRLPHVGSGFYGNNGILH